MTNESTGHPYTPSPGFYIMGSNTTVASSSSSGFEPTYKIPSDSTTDDNDDRRVRRLIKSVVKVSSLMSVLSFITIILQFVVGIYVSVGMMIVLTIPLCGYCGAVHRSRTALWCFITMNIVIAVFYLVSLILTLLTLHGDILACACSSTCTSMLQEYRIMDITNICNHSTYYRTLFWVSVALGLTMTIFQITGCYYGLRLVNHHSFKVRFYSTALPSTAVPVMTKTVYQNQIPSYYVVQENPSYHPVHIIPVPPPSSSSSSAATVSTPSYTVTGTNPVPLMPYSVPINNSNNGTIPPSSPSIVSTVPPPMYTYASPPNTQPRENKNNSSLSLKGSRSRSSSNQ